MRATGECACRLPDTQEPKREGGSKQMAETKSKEMLRATATTSSVPEFVRKTSGGRSEKTVGTELETKGLEG